MEQSRTIQVIDDDPDVLNTVERCLSDQDCRVVTASLWTEAIAQLQDVHPDAVLLDLRLPTVQGEALLEFIRETHPDLPVVIISADVSPSEMGRLSDLGASGFVRKPFEITDLMMALDQVLVDSGAPPVAEFSQPDRDAEDIQDPIEAAEAIDRDAEDIRESTETAEASKTESTSQLPPDILPGSGVQDLAYRPLPAISTHAPAQGYRRKRVRKKKRPGRVGAWGKRIRNYVLIVTFFFMIAGLLYLMQQGLNTGFLGGISVGKSATGEQAP